MATYIVTYNINSNYRPKIHVNKGSINQNLENMICTKNSKLALQNQTMVKEAVPSCLQCLQYSFVMDDGFYWLCRLGLKLSLIYLLKYLGVSPTRVLSECIIRLILAKHSMQFSSNDKMFKA